MWCQGNNSKRIGGCCDDSPLGEWIKSGRHQGPRLRGSRTHEWRLQWSAVTNSKPQWQSFMRSLPCPLSQPRLGGECQIKSALCLFFQSSWESVHFPSQNPKMLCCICDTPTKHVPWSRSLWIEKAVWHEVGMQRRCSEIPEEPTAQRDVQTTSFLSHFCTSNFGYVKVQTVTPDDVFFSTYT